MWRRYFIVLIIIVLMGIIYFTSFFIKKERSFNENLRLKQENEELRAQVQKLEIGNYPLVLSSGSKEKLEIPQKNFLAVKVFSAYPFNIKNQITINVGEEQGIRKSAPVLLGENILIGQINEVFKNYSVVKTIFDSNFQLPVRIGKDEINALFQGAGEPKAVLIDKEKPIQIGDVVYSASSEFPYGLKIGEISETKETSAGVFKEAILKMPFNVNELREVNVRL